MRTGEAAKALGITRQRLNELGRIGKATREPDGTWNVEKVARELGRNLDHRQHKPETKLRPKPASKASKPAPKPQAPPATPPPVEEDAPDPELGPPKGTLLYEQWRHTKEKADAEAMANAILEGKLLKRDEVQKAWEQHRDAIKNRLMLLEAKVPPECRAIVSREVRSALNELSESCVE